MQEFVPHEETEMSSPTQYIKLERDVVLVSEIFSDLHSIINTQGEHIDIIENEVTSAQNKVEKAEDILVDSKKIKNSISSISIYLTGSLLCVLTGTPLGVAYGVKTAIIAVGSIGGATIIYDRMKSFIS